MFQYFKNNLVDANSMVVVLSIHDHLYGTTGTYSASMKTSSNPLRVKLFPRALMYCTGKMKCPNPDDDVAKFLVILPGNGIGLFGCSQVRYDTGVFLSYLFLSFL